MARAHVPAILCSIGLLTRSVCLVYIAALPREAVMRKWILFGALFLGLIELEWGLERWADQIAKDHQPSSAQSMDSPYPPPRPTPTPAY